MVAGSALVIISVFHSREVIGCRHYEGRLEHEALIDLAAQCRQNDWGLSHYLRVVDRIRERIQARLWIGTKLARYEITSMKTL
jgi:hypothetical protein